MAHEPQGAVATSDPVVRLERVSKRFPGGTIGLDAIDLSIRSGEFLTLLGPSGCGKTTTLRVVAGFEQPSGGRVLLDGRDITALRPYDRPVNTVFQDYALFPHLSVANNVGFGLSLRGLSGADLRKKVADALALVGLSEKLEARVTALSGGQRQRVALARAIVCEPRVLLLDEPMSALDAHLREQMQVELKRLQAELGTTFVMVTHDQMEALAISDRIVVMNKGRIEQLASPAELYDAPATRFVAGFIGTMNVIEGSVLGRDSSGLAIDVGGLDLRGVAAAAGPVDPGSRVTLALRPEDLSVRSAEAGVATMRLTGTVFHGRTLRLHGLLPDGTALIVDAPRDAVGAGLSPGDHVGLSARPGAGRMLD